MTANIHALTVIVALAHSLRVGGSARYALRERRAFLDTIKLMIFGPWLFVGVAR